ncbi:type-F conjugative transfer system protein TrbI [Salmonella enterica]|nr:type-F conjugative transfer system protein TrbI [Salmonella enterica]EBP3873452.1 type-F conjugative transfer system protein TrbI [Salmonella enterica subsp. enterica]EBV5793293.1 type-F conjugative transfer system protein TrbI [Salmonella enterica subsp. enterica serovar Rubislaw]EBV7838565.1 type-F conjugative transfer system protein TrbI [Salmonella enterica subsp. enterica serovar Berta]EDD0024275.1 type-F conjugative transfer system protein TrbI [Salmonella enterica subsp. enterica sero
MKTEQQVNDTQSKPTTARKALTQRERQRRRCLRSLLLVTATILCINAAVTSLLISWRTPTVVSFDMKKTLDQFTDQAGAQSLNETQSTALTERFMQTLSAELQEYQRRHDALILVTPAVVSGAADITGDIQAAVAQKMAAGGGQ